MEEQEKWMSEALNNIKKHAFFMKKSLVDTESLPVFIPLHHHLQMLRSVPSSGMGRRVEF
jgi:hypothetical protein